MAVFLAACGSPESPSQLPNPTEYLMAGTAYASPLYVIPAVSEAGGLDGAAPGPTVLVLGGVHGDEPGGWMAAEELVRKPPRNDATLIVLPRANRLAVESGVRSTSDLGDLNRQYPGGANRLPMSRMAAEIVSVIRRYDVDVVIDLHESWERYSDDAGADVDTAAIGQTISPHRSEPSRSMAQSIVERVNRKVSKGERFHYYEYPAGYGENTIVPLPDGLPASAIPGNSSLYLPEVFPGLTSITVEVSQQQSLKKRTSLQLKAVGALLAELDEQRSSQR